MKVQRVPLLLLASVCAGTLVSCCVPLRVVEDRRALELGRADVAGLRMPSELPPVNRIELNRITATEEPVAPNSALPLRGAGPIALKKLAGKTLTGTEAAQFLGAWRTLHTGWSYSGLCHEPAYQLRFFNDARLITETSVCYKCQNFSVRTPDGWRFCGFDTQNEAGRRVFNLLTNHVPLTAAAPGR